jgi:hypothetical protein
VRCDVPMVAAICAICYSAVDSANARLAGIVCGCLQIRGETVTRFDNETPNPLN